MAKPTITDIFPGSSIASDALSIPLSVFEAAGLTPANFTTANGSKILASLLLAAKTSLTGKDDDIDYSVANSLGFDSIVSRADNISYTATQINFSVYVPRTDATLDPDNVA